ncbi:MAG: response regulator [bacterium]|nr:response regulator [bacterium]MDD5353860.1 response regulator [bacterium]MDD5757362.1 response regulator [bacterium]
MAETKKKILLVDDAADIVTVIRMRLESSGYEVIVARDGKEALNTARSLRPDLIVLDLMLPGMDGFHVARMLKYDAQYKDIPIIMLTAKAGESDRKTGAEVGADAFMNKPFEAEKLLAKIRELLAARNPDNHEK